MLNLFSCLNISQAYCSIFHLWSLESFLVWKEIFNQNMSVTQRWNSFICLFISRILRGFLVLLWDWFCWSPGLQLEMGWWTLFPSPRMKFQHLCQMLRLVQAGDDDDNDDKRVAAPLTECDYGNDLLLSQKCHSSHHQRLAVHAAVRRLFILDGGDL